MENIDPSLCTHLMYAFFGISADGEVTLRDSYLDVDLQNIKKTIALKNRNPNLKVMASIGGWNEGSERFSAVSEILVRSLCF